MKGDSIHTFENGGKESSFFCMHLVNYLSQEREANQLDPVIIGAYAQCMKIHCKHTREFN